MNVGSWIIADHIPENDSYQTLGTIPDIGMKNYSAGNIRAALEIVCNMRPLIREEYDLLPGIPLQVDMCRLLQPVFEKSVPAIGRIRKPQASTNLKEITLKLVAYDQEGGEEDSVQTRFFLLNHRLNNLDKRAVENNLLSVAPQRKTVPPDHREILSLFTHNRIGTLLCEAYNGVSYEVRTYAESYGMVHTVVDFSLLPSLFGIENIEQYYFYLAGSESEGIFFSMQPDPVRKPRWFYFENAAGGFDSIPASGARVDKNKYTSLHVLAQGNTVEYGIDHTYSFDENSGYLETGDWKAYYREFLASTNKFVREGDRLRRIITEEAAADDTMYQAGAATFSWRYADERSPVLCRNAAHRIDRGSAGSFMLNEAWIKPSATEPLEFHFLRDNQPYFLGGKGEEKRDYEYRMSPVVSKYLVLDEINRKDQSVGWPAGYVLQVKPVTNTTCGFFSVVDTNTGEEATGMIVLEP